jgi:hypothetical protein
LFGKKSQSISSFIIENAMLVLLRAVGHIKDNQQAIIGDGQDRGRSLTTEHGIMSLAILESLRGNNVASMPWQLAA